MNTAKAVSRKVAKHAKNGRGGLMARALRQNLPAALPPYLLGVVTEATCIGCGCSDSHACVTAPTLDAVSTELSACFWVKVDRKLGIGVCSECTEKLEEYKTLVSGL